jgi:hypothetical protein
VHREISKIRKRRKILQQSGLLTARYGTMAVAVVILASGCGTLTRNAVPVDRMHDAEVPGFADVRA